MLRRKILGKCEPYHRHRPPRSSWNSPAMPTANPRSLTSTSPKKPRPTPWTRWKKRWTD